MPNHFHLVVRIRKREKIEELIRNKINNNSSINNNFPKVQNFGKVEVIISDKEIERFLSKQFANLFSCYTQSFNKVYHRMGSLFIKNFKRESIRNKTYFINAIIYTHRNPIHHGFRTKYEEWEFSSYNDILDGISDNLEVGRLLKTFGGFESFKEMHRQGLNSFTSPDELDIP
jgi:REP element-mobilizing transposase RayT